MIDETHGVEATDAFRRQAMKVTFVGLYVSPRTFEQYGYGPPSRLIRLNRKAAQTFDVEPPPPTKMKVTVKIPGARVTRFYVGMRSYVNGIESGRSSFMPFLMVEHKDELHVAVVYEDNGWYKEHR